MAVRSHRKMKKYLCKGGIAVNRWLKKIKAKAILPAAAFMAAAAIGTTFAWQTWDLDVTNQLKAHDTDVEIAEEFAPYEYKKVQFKNTGSSSVFLRVSYTEHWELPDKTVLSNVVDGSDVAIKNWTEEWNSEWQDGGDGWYYYKKVLPGGAATAIILDGVDFSYPTSDGRYFSAAKYYLYFKAEVVQCSDGSNTLNSAEVNADSTKKMFGKTASVDTAGNVTWN